MIVIHFKYFYLCLDSEEIPLSIEERISKFEIEVKRQLQKQKEETQKSLVNILNLIDSMEQWMRYEYNQILK